MDTETSKTDYSSMKDSTGNLPETHELDCQCEFCEKQRRLNQQWREAGW